MSNQKKKSSNISTYDEYLQTYFPNSYKEYKTASVTNPEQIGIVLAREDVEKIKKSIIRQSKRPSPQSA